MRLRAIATLCGLFAGSLTACRQAVPGPVSDRPNVLLITIDTFRADRLGVGLTPTLDALAESGVRFTSARTAVPLTLPSHATILTGLLPPLHGVRENGSGGLRPEHQTLAPLLKAAGYETAAFVGAFVLDRQFGLATGFDVYDDRIRRGADAPNRLEAERPASEVVDHTIAWLDAPRAQAAARPFFVWMHLYDPHAPYDPPQEYRTPGRSLYDGEIAFADAQVARVLTSLRARGVLDHTLVVVAGDHGEGLGDHGERAHGMLLYDSTVRVPLVIVPPAAGRRVGRRDDPVNLFEIAPTILRVTGITPPALMHGRDLLGDIEPVPDQYSETEYPRVAGWSPLQAMTDGRWKVIRVGAGSEVYDLERDAAEQDNIAAAHASLTIAASARIAAVRAQAGVTTPSRVSPDIADRLRSLGYVAPSAAPAAEATTAAPNPATHIDDWNRFEDALAALSGRAPTPAATLKRLVLAHPDALVFQTTYARALKDAGQTKEALAVYRKAAERWPTEAVLLHDLAVAAHDAAGRTSGAAARALDEEARRADEAAVILAPQSAMAHNGLGLLAAEAGRLQDAARAFERATTIDASNAAYWANLGNARRALGDRGGAEQAYRRGLDADATALDAANGLGVVLIEAARFADAVPWFERALAADPEFAEARLNLGIALQQAGDTKGAIAAYRRVLTSRGGAREKKSAATLLASLGAGR